MSEETFEKELMAAIKRLSYAAKAEAATDSEERANGIWDGTIAMAEVIKPHVDRQRRIDD